MKKQPLVFFAIFLIVCGLIFVFVQERNINKTTVQNSTGSELKSIRLVVQKVKSLKKRSLSLDSLAVGKSCTLKHWFNDSKVTLKFTLDGKEKEFTEPYVDLWRGETWLIDIQPNGTIQSDYHYQ